MKTHLKNWIENHNCDEFDMLAAALLSGSRLFFHLGGRNGLKKKQTVNEFDKSSLCTRSNTYTHLNRYIYSTHKFLSRVKYRHKIQLRCIPSWDLKKQEASMSRAECQLDLCAREKGGILRHNRWVPRVGCQHDLHVKKKQSDVFYMQVSRGGGFGDKTIKPKLWWTHQHAPTSTI